MGDTQSVKITIPERLADISIAKYKKFIAMATEENSDEQAMFHFCGLTPDQQQRMKASDRIEIRGKIANALEEKPQLTQTFKLNGVEYGFHPKIEDISMGEYVDLDEYFKDPYHNATQVLGVLYRPITEKKYGKYLIENYDPDKHTGEAFNDLGVDIFFGCMLFFYRLEIALHKTFLQSLPKDQLMNLPSTSRLSSLESGDGTQR